MNEEQITQKIKQVKQLIVDRRFKKAFVILGEIIEYIDVMDRDDVDDVELENEMLMIRSRFNTFNKKATQGVSTDHTEINQITLAVLNFLDEVKKIALEYSQTNQTDAPPPKEVQETIAPIVIQNPSSQAENKGCLLGLSSIGLNLQLADFNLLKTIRTIGIFLFAFALLFVIFKRTEGCNPPAQVIPPPDSTKTDPNPTIQPAGPDANSLALDAHTMEYDMAEYLSDEDSTFPKTFLERGLLFQQGSAHLSNRAKKQLDQMAKVLKAYPTAQIEIIGFYTEAEEITGSNLKEMGSNLGSQRATAVNNYLAAQGLSDQIYFTSDSFGAKPTVGIVLKRR